MCILSKIHKLQKYSTAIAMNTSLLIPVCPIQQPHNIVQRRLMEGNIPRLRGEARDIPSLVRSPLADSKEGGEPEERSESTVDDSTEERESPEESEKSLRSDEDADNEYEGDSSDAGGKTESKQKDKMGDERKKGLKDGERASSLSALVVQCKVGIHTDELS